LAKRRERPARRLFDRSEDCAGLAEALALTLSMIADGRPLPATQPRDAPAAARVPRPWEVGGGAMGSTGILGAGSLGLTLDAVWHPWPRLAAGLTAFWMPSRGIDGGPGTVKVTVLAGLASVCFGILPFGGRVFPALCGQFGAGALRGRGDEGYADARSVWRPWLAAGGSLHVGVRVHRWLTLAVSAGRLFSLKDERFTIGGLPDPVYDSGHPGWLGTAGLLVRIP
jgi:hypothetical protein